MVQKNLFKNAIEEETILKQIDKSFVLCIDPETRLPFVVNMGLKTADITDLDNRPRKQKEQAPEAANSGSEVESDFDIRSVSDASVLASKAKESKDDHHLALLNPKNYPFYQKVKRNLFILEELLMDEHNDASGDFDLSPHLEAMAAERSKSSAPSAGYENEFQLQ